MGPEPGLPAGHLSRTGAKVLAVDIGGTKVAAGVVTDDGSIGNDHVRPTPTTLDADEVWDTVAGLVSEVLTSSSDFLACGVGCGGPMQGNLVSPLNIPAWRTFPLALRLGDLTGLPTFVENDAKALALGEGWTGAAQGSDNYLAMVVSTGIGGGVVVDGRLLGGRERNAGHLGHVIVEPDGRECRCGARGCLEAEASGTAIAAITGAHPSEAGPAMVERVGTLVGRAVGSVVTLLDIPLALVAGSVALGYGDPFFSAAARSLAASACLPYARGAVIRPGGLGDRGPLVGAGAVGFHGMGRGGLGS